MENECRKQENYTHIVFVIIMAVAPEFCKQNDAYGFIKDERREKSE